MAARHERHSSSSGGGSGSPAEIDDSAEQVRQMRSSRFECLTACLVLIDLGLITHQLSVDVAAAKTDIATKNATKSTTSLRLWQQGSNQFYIAILVFGILFVIESLLRNGQHLLKRKQLSLLNVLDGSVCVGSCALNFGLHFSGAGRILRDLLALLVAARLGRALQLCRGLSHSEKQRLLQLLLSHQQIEAASAERLRMLQTELGYRDLECQDLRALIKAATLSRHRLRMKQQLQMEKSLPEHGVLSSTVSVTPLRRSAQQQQQKQQQQHQYDSGHSSDSAPESPQEAEPTEGMSKVTDEGEEAAAVVAKADVEGSQPPARPELPDHNSTNSGSDEATRTNLDAAADNGP